MRGGGIGKKSYGKARLCLALAFMAGVLVCLWSPENIFGVFDSEKAVHIKADEIENSTLIIGTHLIYLYSVKDELYELAKESASASGQSKIYYKSELSGGAWFDITEAGSLKEITDQGEKADNKEIEELFFTYHTKSDGITYDLLTNQPVSVFDIREHYELENLKEMEALKLQYDMGKDLEGKSETVKRNLGLVQYFFSTETHTEDTDLYDMQIKSLQKYYDSLSGEDFKYRDTLSHVMKKLDDSRCLIVFRIAQEGITLLMDDVGSTYPDNGESEEVEYTLDNALLTAIGESQSALGESIAQAEGNLLEEGQTAISKMEYELSNDLIRGAVIDNYDACHTAVLQLDCLFRIIDGVIADREEELSLLDRLLKTAQGQSGQEEMDYIQRQIEIRKEKTEKDAGEKELEELYEQKEQLSEKRAQALDKLDIETGKKLEAQLIEISEKIEKQNRAKEDSLESLMKRKAELNQKLENNPEDGEALAELSRLKETLAESEGALQGEGRAKSIMDTKNSLITALEKGEVSDSAIASMEKDVEALGAMLDFGSSLAMSSMKEVYIKMSGDACIHNTKAYDGLLAKMEQAIEESDVRTLEQKGGLTREMAEEVLREFDTTSKTAHVLGLGEYVRETGRLQTWRKKRPDCFPGKKNLFLRQTRF